MWDGWVLCRKEGKWLVWVDMVVFVGVSLQMTVGVVGREMGWWRVPVSRCKEKDETMSGDRKCLDSGGLLSDSAVFENAGELWFLWTIGSDLGSESR
jgi:hypothetical protein